MPFELDAADHALLETDAGAGNMGAGGREDALHAGSGIGRAAHDLDLARRSVSTSQNPQAVGIGMLVAPRSHAPR